MTIFSNPDFIQIDDITFSFNIRTGLQNVKALNHHAILNLSDDDLPKLFMPYLSNNLRRFGLEAIVNGNNTQNDKDFILDLIDLIEISRKLSQHQFKCDYTKALLVDKIQNMELKNDRSQRIVNVLLKLFGKGSIPVSINYIYDFNKMFNVDDTSYVQIMENCINNMHILTKIAYYHPHDKYSHKSVWFYGKFMLTVIGAVSKYSDDVKVSRSLRSLRYHITESTKFFKTDEEIELVKKLVEKAEPLAKERLYEIERIKSLARKKVASYEG